MTTGFVAYLLCTFEGNHEKIEKSTIEDLRQKLLQTLWNETTNLNATDWNNVSQKNYRNSMKTKTANYKIKLKLK